MSKNIRLAAFIRAEIEPILQDWEEFAKTILHANHMDTSGLRDHARNMLLVIADDIDSDQNEFEQTAKSKGCGPDDGNEPCARASCRSGLKRIPRLPALSLKILPGFMKR
ncbi:hypothetical protein [Vreelandella neptunia]|uniref:Uncharacterized protein n=1 Tax=Vreelandella neptunia TaxID=115551 RepID=A0ABZ0YP27_9GAMM|nr:hypothetical protein [Halomonas neptunia]MDN3558923.1 hypothetical protein [Halomonas neptunia]WQH13888.1 hypothetical protein SR894_04920 [Halomonas neptunia]